MTPRKDWESTGMVKMVDTQDLGSCALERIGSSPITSTVLKPFGF